MTTTPVDAPNEDGRDSDVLDEEAIARVRADLRDPARGWHILRGFHSTARISAYRAECAEFLRHGRRFFKRLNTDWMFDYVHPRSYDDEERTHRIYQYLHNHQSPTATHMFRRTLRLRDDVERPWMQDAVYREEATQQSHVVVTRYLPGSGRIMRHTDYQGPAREPFLQSLVLLSRPGVDFEGGELVLYPRAGAPVRVLADAGLAPGDLLFFDKSLEHEVELCQPGQTDVGRWSVTIGSRAPRHTAADYVKFLLLYNAATWPALHRAKVALKTALAKK